MLKTLVVKNIALIDSVSLDFSTGLLVLTGETGAGKSLIVDAVSLLLGARADRELIRRGEEKAYVEGLFSLADCPAAARALREAEVDCSEEVLLSREITQNGRSTCRADGIPLSLQAYQQITANLMDLHGQHAHQSLLNDKNHLRFLDAFGEAPHRELLARTEETYGQWQETRKKLLLLEEKESEKEERSVLLSMRLRELLSLAPEPGEEEELQRERDRFRGSEKLTEAVQSAYDALYGGQDSAWQQLQSACGALDRATAVDDLFSDAAGRLRDAFYEVEDISMFLRDQRDQLNFDPEREEEVLSRLDLYRRLSRKYHVEADGLKALAGETQQELDGLTNLKEQLEDARFAEEQARGRYDAAAAALSKSRKALAGRFSAAVEKQLKDLNLGGCAFSVSLTDGPRQKTGTQSAVFLIAANPGEPAHALSKTASGGELSRIMLGIKAAAAEKNVIPSMVFDEIDTGISGRAAQAAAEKMALLSRGRQVLCVTHLQQIAAMADGQYLVEKNESQGRTLSRCRLLGTPEREEEIARILGGAHDSALKLSREMLSAARQYKESLIKNP